MGAVKDSNTFSLLLNLLVGLRVLVLEAQVLQLRLDAVQAQSVGQGRIDVEGFAGNLVLLAGPHGPQRAHIVQAVGNLDEDDADIVVHRQQQLLEVLGLRRGAVTEDAARNLGQPVHDLCDFRAEQVLDVLYRIVRVFHHIMQQGRADGSRSQADFHASDAGHGDGMQDIRFARASAHAFVRLSGEIECFRDNLHFSPVPARQVSVQQFLKSLVDELLVCLLLSQFFIRHNGIPCKLDANI